MTGFCRWPALIAAALGWLAFAAAAQAQSGYPDRPVKIIVPIGPGGSYDLVARYLADALSKRMGQAFFVENKVGAGTVVGTVAAAQSEPDGYTLMMGGLSNMAFNSALYAKLGYDPLKISYRWRWSTGLAM
jgi:tripartite-type tricarboxylate transporter receptor subunit TctC